MIRVTSIRQSSRARRAHRASLRHHNRQRDARGLLHPNGEWRLLSPEEMAERWKGREEGLEESDRIAGECDFDLALAAAPPA